MSPWAAGNKSSATTGRARFKITDAGLDLLAQRPARIDKRVLQSYEPFRTLTARPRRTAPDHPKPAADAEETPLEALASSYQLLRMELARELLGRIADCGAVFFEDLVLDLIVAMGYGGSRAEAGRRVGRSGDGGIDGLINQGPLGLDTIYIQAKRWQHAVGRPEVQAFAGSMMGQHARKGVLITTSTFTADASKYVESIQEPKIVLIDGERLGELMIDHNVGVSEVDRFVIKKVDSDYFADGD